MIRTSIGRRTSDGTAAAAALEIIASATKGFFLKELWLSMAAATASVYGIGFPAAKGITPTSPVTNLVESGLDTLGGVKTAIAWATGPTVPAAFLRRIGLPATVGAGLPAPWVFGNQGLYVPAGQSLVLWNIGTNGVVDVSIVVDEQP